MLRRLQKENKDTNELIDLVKEYLFSVGVRTSRERAWDIFKSIHQMPYKMMVEKNKEIEYQGQGAHISHKHGDQMLSIHGVGKFRLLGASCKKDKEKRAVIKFEPSNDIQRYIRDNVKVINKSDE